jgi:hypothetical protein
MPSLVTLLSSHLQHQVHANIIVLFNLWRKAFI